MQLPSAFLSLQICALWFYSTVTANNKVGSCPVVVTIWSGSSVSNCLLLLLFRPLCNWVPLEHINWWCSWFKHYSYSLISQWVSVFRNVAAVFSVDWLTSWVVLLLAMCFHVNVPPAAFLVVITGLFEFQSRRAKQPHFLPLHLWFLLHDWYA